MTILTSFRSFGSLMTQPKSWEQDPDYRDVLSRINQQGLLVAGFVALAGLIAYVATGLLILSKTPILIPRKVPIDLANVMTMWDKLLVLGAGAMLVAASRVSHTLRWGRAAGALTVLILATASVFDEVVGGTDISRATVYPMVYLLVVAATIAYRPLQMLGLSIVTFGLVVACEALFPVMVSVPVEGTIIGQMPFVVISTIVLTGLSTLLSSTRHDQYLARREAQQLAARLEEHARRLEEAKAVADEQTTKLIEAEHMKDRFFGNISHEFRTPLTMIMGPVEDALAGAHGSLQPPLTAMLTGVRRNSDRLLLLVNDLLDLSKLDARRIRLNRQEHDLVEFARTVMHHFVDEAARRKVTLTFEASVERLPVTFDRNAIEKVIYNLLSNACKFVSDGGAVRVRVEPRGAVARLTVKDNGPGIDPAELPRIWDRFHRIEREGYAEGTGVGLALVKELVQLHGGHVGVQSDVGFGSEFAVTLPMQAEVEATTSAYAEEVDTAVESVEDGDTFADAESAPERSPIVLVVENDPDVRGYIRSHLQSLYRVRVAFDGVEAMESIHDERPALVISDVMMPRMDGVELCRTIKRDPDLADIPVVLLTARADEETRLEGLSAGADDYILKPFSSAALVARAENLIELRRMLRQRFTEGIFEPSPVDDVPSFDESFMAGVKAVVEEHIGDSQFGVDWLASEVGLSSRQLQRRVRSITRLSAGGYIRLLRLNRAAQLFDRQAGNVSEVANLVGYNDAAYFSRLFKQTFGILPSEYLGQNASGAAGD